MKQILRILAVKECLFVQAHTRNEFSFAKSDGAAELREYVKIIS